jgi:hypothetical protein
MKIESLKLAERLSNLLRKSDHLSKVEKINIEDDKVHLYCTYHYAICKHFRCNPKWDNEVSDSGFIRFKRTIGTRQYAIVLW